MSRCTQYVGLNSLAHRIVANATSTENFQLTTGMFEEPVGGTIYHVPPPPGPNKAAYFKEEVQEVLWSSGPMIFTCLRGFLEKEGGQTLDMGTCAEWAHDPTLHGEWDFSAGTINV